VARTIADLAEKYPIESEHISEAIQPALPARHSSLSGGGSGVEGYRTLDRQFWI
jgi:hypothetical protein